MKKRLKVRIQVSLSEAGLGVLDSLARSYGGNRSAAIEHAINLAARDHADGLSAISIPPEVRRPAARRR